MSFKAAVSLLVFCLEDMSIDANEMFKSPTMNVLLPISPFMSIKIYFTCIGAAVLDA